MKKMNFKSLAVGFALGAIILGVGVTVYATQPSDVSWSTISTTLSTVSTNISTLATKLTTLALAGGTVEDEIKTIDTSLGTVATEIATIDTSLGTVATEIATIDTSLGTVATEIATIDTSVGNIATQTTALVNAVEDGNTDSATIATQVTALVNAVEDGNTDSATIATQVTALVNAVEDGNTDSATIATQVTALVNAVEDGNTDSATMATQLTALVNAVEDGNTDSATMATQLTNLVNAVEDGNTDSATIATQMALLVTATNNVANYAVDVVNECWISHGGNGIYCEGATANAYELFRTPEDPTADVTITYPDATGKVVLTLKSDFDAQLDDGTTATAGSTVQLDQYEFESGKAIRATCAGTITGTNDTKTLNILAGSTVAAAVVIEATDAGDFVGYFTVGAENGATVKASGVVSIDNAAAVDADFQETAFDPSPTGGVLFAIQIDLANTADALQMEYCIWELLP